MTTRAFNSSPYPLIQGDTRPPLTLQIGDSTGAAADFSRFASLVVTAHWREKDAAAVTASIVMSAVDASAGQYRIDAWPTAALAGDEGRYELEIEVDYLGDGTSVETVFDTVQFKLHEDFA